MAKDRPLVQMSWLALLAFEDLPEFSDLAGVPAEHLLQSLLYRLRECGEDVSDSVQETVKVVTPFKMAPFDPPSDSFAILFRPLAAYPDARPAGSRQVSRLKVPPIRWVLFSL